MRRRGRAGMAAGAVLASVVLVVPPARAYDPITWDTVDGGGAFGAASGGYTLGGAIGQYDAGTMAGGGWTLAGGFWGGGAPPVTAVSDETPVSPFTFRFDAPSPNPVRFSALIAFELPATSDARLTVFDVAGRSVRIEDYGVLPAGHYAKEWSPRDDAGRPLSGGVYFMRLDAGGERGTRKVLVLR